MTTFNSKVILPDGQALPVSLSVLESWKTSEGLRVKAILYYPEGPKRQESRGLTVRSKESLSNLYWHQCSVDVRETPLKMWGYNLQLSENGLHYVALFEKDEEKSLATFELDIKSLSWKRL